MESRSRHMICWFFIAVVANAIVGCGPSGPKRLPLKGAVIRAGKPLKEGAISLIPAKGHQGVAANGSIADGKYEFTRENGPSPGPQEVTIQEFLPKMELMKRQESPNAPPIRWTFQYEVLDEPLPMKDFTIE